MAGNLVAFPTETVYGLGADARNEKAVARIYSVKGRPSDHPLIVHIASIDCIQEWAIEVPEYAIVLARDFWPGPMTLVFKRSHFAADFITGGQDTVGLRVPNHEIALALLASFERVGGKGVAAPSANRFGRVSPTNAAAVIEELGQFMSSSDLVMDGGVSSVGIESTIIDCTGRTPHVLRPGAVTPNMIEESTGLKAHNIQHNAIRVSGSLENHYSPSAKILFNQTPRKGQGFIAHAVIDTPKGVFRLASPQNDDEFAHLLYFALREADKKGISEVVVVLPDGQGIAAAVRDRLSRAANRR